MRCFDVCNGDADGLCALRQLRLAEPRAAELVAGLKRDIALLERVAAQSGDRVTVLDVSLDRNRAALLALLDAGVHVEYFDHHAAHDAPRHPNLALTLDPSPCACTSILVDRHLGGRYRKWAVAGAFGDNLPDAARELAAGLGLGAAPVEMLRRLGEGINYNAYGESEADVLVPPAELYRLLARYADPLDLVQGEPLIERIARQQEADLELALATRPRRLAPAVGIYALPDAAWSRRVSGIFANRLAADAPDRVHAVLTPRRDGTYQVSLRVPLGRTPDAATFCAGFPTGGGRILAAGIDRLPAAGLAGFTDAVVDTWKEPCHAVEPSEWAARHREDLG